MDSTTQHESDVEFYSNIRHCLDDIVYFDEEEKRIFNLCIKIMDLAFGYNKGNEIRELLNENQFKEVDAMLVDVIENAKYEKEQLVAEGELKGELKKALKIAKSMLIENFSIDYIMHITELSREQIEEIELD